MNYDLTSLLITISAASASFSAILGGIIGSKLLSINGDRDINSQQIDDLTEELILKVERRDRFEYQINENIALEFFRSFISRLLNEDALESFFSENKKQTSLEMEILLPYWNRALSITKKIKEELSFPCIEHKDGIPTAIEPMLNKDSFQKEIVLAVMNHLYQFPDKSYWESCGIHLPQTMNHIFAANCLLSDAQQAKLTSEVSKLTWEIEQLELKLKLLKQKKEALKRPRGITIGLWIFAAFSFVNMILPLLLCGFDISDIITYRWIKYGSIGVFALGLIATLGYLIYMLKWNPDKTRIYNSEKGDN